MNLVPYRQSKLTRLFQENFETGSAVMIAAVSPSDKDADETIFGLRCSVIAQQVKVSTVVRKDNLGPRDSLAIRRRDSGAQALITSMERQLAQAKQWLEDERGRALELARENRELRIKVAEAESKAIVIEAEIREEVSKELQEALDAMAETYEEQLRDQRERYEEAAESRIDAVTRTARKHIDTTLRAARRAELETPCKQLDMDVQEEQPDSEETEHQVSCETVEGRMPIPFVGGDEEAPCERDDPNS
eukprot:Plantae.Rhodophyta-Rhodochaete_pulchella.ctg10153.p2 GENE.Plantae.Rhodophyta-Rhodochaete_pulchella.ctg10153~~Plantae.Rhodophyta-Rhodochaete_pulchella.ctg10153.p2  ORF type:complete len:267 (+),score=60.33 Plantae.Rhodophyta-Rhodochaete_pulchella.ctg10153:58-801(+)